MFDGIKGIAFDLDGTLYLGDSVIEGAVETIQFLKLRGLKICFFTNSSVRTRAQIRSKLQKIGIPVDDGDEVFTSAYATGIYLREKKYKRCFCIGATGLKEEVVHAGAVLVEEDVEAVVVGLDNHFTYDHITKALNILKKNNCVLIACNLDRTFPVEDGYLMPGCGPIAAAIQTSSEKPFDFIVGKPNTYMLEMLSKRWGYAASEILVVGDSFESDIQMAVNYNSPSVLICEGLKQQGTISVNNIKNLLDFF